MPEQLKVGQRRVWMHKGVVDPDFAALHVLSNDPWKFVELYLKRAGSHEAHSFWLQAQRFSDVSRKMSPEAAPLTLYYCFLNASKALLSHKNVNHGNSHGVSGSRPSDARASLANETIRFKNGGILPSLCHYFNEGASSVDYSLKGILWNIPFIHRAFKLSFTSESEIFVPLEEARYIRHDNTSEAWFEARIVPRYCDLRLLRNTPRSFEIRREDEKMYLFRRKRFRWYIGHTRASEKKAAQARLSNYHASTRRLIVNISGERDLWYLRKSVPGNPLGARHTSVLVFAAMHRLSELSRYDPAGLDRHLSGKANWLLVEFINHASGQFIDQIATEITGSQFWPPKIRS